MICLINDSLDCTFNLALEEALLRRGTDEYFILWRNKPAVVCGRNQNVFEETDILLAEKENVSVIKRYSGGGCVYHDDGCLNYTLIVNNKDSRHTCNSLTLTVVKALIDMGIDAKLGDSGAVTVGNLKISGGAEAGFRDRLLHHGTLLFSTDLAALDRYTGHRTGFSRLGTVNSRSVKSRVSGVGNLRELLPYTDIEDFARELAQRIDLPITERRPPDPTEIASAVELGKEKYSTWEWTFGSSPRFSFCGIYQGERISYDAYHGIIEHTDSPMLEKALGQRLIVSELAECLGEYELARFMITGECSPKLQSRSTDAHEIADF